MKVVTSWTDSLAYGDGVDMEVAPPAPAEIVLPDLEQWVTLLELTTWWATKRGTGTTPILPPQILPGNWFVRCNVTEDRQSPWNARFEIGMNEITDHWSLANGFSHQIVQIYVDPR